MKNKKQAPSILESLFNFFFFISIGGIFSKRIRIFRIFFESEWQQAGEEWIQEKSKELQFDSKN